VHVDEAGRDRAPRAVDRLARLGAVEGAARLDRGDPVAAHRERAAHARRAGPVEEHSAAQQEVEHGRQSSSAG
jgi:hypothetical protein